MTAQTLLLCIAFLCGMFATGTAVLVGEAMREMQPDVQWCPAVPPAARAPP
jgi:hypothetical protein